MKKIYFSLIAILGTFICNAQVIITELADPQNEAGARYVEIYNLGGTGSVDLTDWELRRWTNDNADPQTSGVDLTPIGSLTAGSYAIIAADGTVFQSIYGFAPDISAGTGGAADSNGDDQIALFDSSDATIDIFGVPGEDGSGTCHEFEDGRAERKASVTAPNSTWNESEWNTWSDSGPSGGTTCANQTVADQLAPSDFDPGAWIGDSTACNVSFGEVSYTCLSNTAGDNNDNVIINISYSGSDSSIISVTTTNGGTLGGDDPALTADGTITISGLGEGDAWDITLNGGDCDGTTTSGTVGTAECDPTPSTCFDLSMGMEQFELVTVTTNSDTDTWTESSGTYNMNGYCGGGCAELVESWLVFGPLDMSSVTDLSLLFDAVKDFDETDLNIKYTSAYSGCPSSTSWSTAQTITVSGNYDVDLSSATGTDVYIGIEYNDDGANGYADWTLTNVELASFGACPTLGTRVPSDCAICDVALQTENYVCTSNTAGADNDSVTIEIPYTGSDSSIMSITTTSGGSIGGDDPALIADGTIEITGLGEGDAWDITLNGGDCGGTTVSGTVPSTLCDPTNCPNVGDIIITEIMQNPSAVNDTDGEYFEVYNTTGASIDINGWTISDLGTNSHTIDNMGPLNVPAGGYLVLGINSDSGTNGGANVDYEYSSISLGNSDDEIILTCGMTVIDQVIYDGGPNFPDPDGASMQLSPTALDDISNDNGSNWATGNTTYGSGDFGTPGAANDNVLSNENFENTTFSLYPNPSNGNTVTISSSRNEAISLQVFDILGKQVKNETLTNNTLNVSNLKSGVYIVKITQSDASTTKKLVIK